MLTGRQAGYRLNPVGRAHAERLATLAVSHVVSSPLERARETAEPLARAFGVEVEVDPAFVELDYGDWTGRTVDSLEHDPAWRLWNAQRAVGVIPGGETMVAVQVRTVAALNRLRERFADAQVAVVSHGDVIRAMLCAALGLSLDHLTRFDIAPASHSIIRFEVWGTTVVRINGTVG